MKISNLVIDKIYLKISNYGKPAQEVKIIEIQDNNVRTEFVGDNFSRGMVLTFNKIEVERYFREL